MLFENMCSVNEHTSVLSLLIYAPSADYVECSLKFSFPTSSLHCLPNDNNKQSAKDNRVGYKNSLTGIMLHLIMPMLTFYHVESLTELPDLGKGNTNHTDFYGLLF